MKKNDEVNKSALARDLGVARSSLYYRSKLDLRDGMLKEQILSVLQEHPAYGHRRIALHLGINKKQALRVMKKFGIKPLICRGRKPAKPGDIGRKPSRYCNYFKYLCPLRPGIFWAADFTYIWFGGRFYFLATIIDVVSREIVGIAFSPYHTKQLVMEALKDALSKNPPPIYLHSDQGSEYNSEAYVKLATYYGITISMSAKGKPWENAFQESFYSQFKLELGPTKYFSHLGQMIEAIYLQIHYYNYQRIHTSLKMPPKKYASLYSIN